jgi:predicted small metal-binding protein
MILLEVMCPICDHIIAGHSEDELSSRLQSHMVKEHRLRGACDLDAPSSGLATVCRPPLDKERAKKPYEDVLSSEGDKKGGPSIPGEDVFQSVRCPTCGQTILGHDINDLSFYMGEHMKQEHDIIRLKKKEG